MKANDGKASLAGGLAAPVGGWAQRQMARMYKHQDPGRNFAKIIHFISELDFGMHVDGDIFTITEFAILGPAPAPLGLQIWLGPAATDLRPTMEARCCESCEAFFRDRDLWSLSGCRRLTVAAHIATGRLSSTMPPTGRRLQFHGTLIG